MRFISFLIIKGYGFLDILSPEWGKNKIFTENILP